MTAPKVLISDKISQAAIDIFKNRNVDVDYKPGMTKDELIACIGEYDGLAIRSATKVDADVLAAATKLKVIGRAGIGVDNVDIPAATARGVIVMNTPFGNAITTAEHAIAMLFAASRQIGAADVSTQAGKWEKNRFNGVELYAKTLGIIGCGNIGSIVADRALGLKMKVVAFDPFLSPERALEIGVEKVELDELLARADAITMHVPLTAQTKNVLSAESLAKTKKGVIIVNCARGGLVDEAALAEHLKTGRVGAAAFDVFAEEPAKENVLFGCPNFTATPHLGAATTEAQENVALQVAEQIADYVLSGAITNALNTASVTAEEAPKLKPFVALAEKLGAFAGQIVDDGLEAIEIEYEGEVTGLNMKPLTASLIAGILKPLLSDINMVSAPSILKERGTPFSESKRDLSPTFDSVIRVKVKTGGKWRTVAGAVIGGQPRIVEIKGMPLEAPFHPIMLFINNSDTPGFIGALGMKLGAAGINIATFNLGRVAEGEDAIALVGIDQAVPASIASELKALPQVRYVKQLSF
jgi:D-3-phosphoglycerate dehydrogenase / 2-oxoglutarate reductase